MTNLMNYAKSFVNQEEGQDLLEYALLVALIALVAIVAVLAATPVVVADIEAEPGSEGGLYVVGVGASAGGLEALERFFKSVPPRSQSSRSAL